MDTINEFWDYDTDVHQWTLPDGHIARVPVTEMSDIRIEIDELNHRTFTYRYSKQQPSENYRSLVANIIHSIDGYIAREMVRRCDFQLCHIHDCFVFNPNHLQEVSKTYREIMAGIAKSDLFSNILRQITGNSSLQIAKSSTDLDLAILNSNYMLS